MSLSPPLFDESFDQEGYHSIRNQVFLPRKETTCPAVLKMKLTIVPMRPGRMEANLFADFLKAISHSLCSTFQDIHCFECKRAYY